MLRCADAIPRPGVRPAAAVREDRNEALIDRRAFLGALGLFIAPLGADAQQKGKVYRIGFLGNESEPAARKAYDDGLRERGWREGQNFVWERRFSEGRNERFPALAADLVQAKPDVIITIGTAAKNGQHHKNNKKTTNTYAHRLTPRITYYSSQSSPFSPQCR